MLTRTFYRRHLPHIHPIGATFFITFRLVDSLPKSTVEWLKEKIVHANSKMDNEEFMKALYTYDRELDQNPKGACHLRKKEVADIVKAKLHQYDAQYYDLIAYCIMPNHVHILIDTSVQLPPDPDGEPPTDYKQVDQILKLIKGGAASLANRLLNRKGIFWKHESYDRYIRDSDHLESVIHYILMNPVKASLVSDANKWEHSYYKYK